MQAVIRWVLSNVFLWTAVLAVVIGLIKKKNQLGACSNILQQLFFWFAGLAFLWSGAMHLLMPAFTAAQIGWQDSPFQFEVGLANLSICLLGFMATFVRNRWFHLGVILALAIFSVGAGLGHVYQTIVQHDHASSNSGSILYTDIVVPLFMLVIWFGAKSLEAGRRAYLFK